MKMLERARGREDKKERKRERGEREREISLLASIATMCDTI